ncbi:MAG TPA: AAA family ATPase [archaeon]|nr:AAA family ATPase [archaeon]
MKKSILVTGVSGAGKSAISKKLNELGYKAYDMDDFPGLFTMINQKTGEPVVGHDNSNLEKVAEMDWICDKNKLQTIISDESNQLVFYCGSASNIDEILPLFDLVILLKVSPEAMRHRLTTRTENDFGRTSEVQDWIMTWKDWWENDLQQKGAVVVDACGSLDQVVKELIKKGQVPFFAPHIILDLVIPKKVWYN